VDGAGAFDFTQGTTSGNDFWNLVATALVEPSEEVQKCHAPKPVLLSTGEVCIVFLFYPITLNLLIKSGKASTTSADPLPYN
jgi:neutral ceramidase